MTAEAVSSPEKTVAIVSQMQVLDFAISTGTIELINAENEASFDSVPPSLLKAKQQAALMTRLGLHAENAHAQGGVSGIIEMKDLIEKNFPDGRFRENVDCLSDQIIILNACRQIPVSLVGDGENNSSPLYNLVVDPDYGTFPYVKGVKPFGELALGVYEAINHAIDKRQLILSNGGHQGADFIGGSQKTYHDGMKREVEALHQAATDYSKWVAEEKKRRYQAKANVLVESVPVIEPDYAI